MEQNKYKKAVQGVLDLAGIKINGNQPWDIKVHNEDLYKRVLSGGSLALGESYMDGWWDCEQVDEFFNKILKAELDKKVKNKFQVALLYIGAKFFNPQTKSKSSEVGEVHYDIGNDLYEKMLDKRMVYTCGYWDGVGDTSVKNLDQAQEAKLDLVCKKINLQPGQKVLDIGCGWGSFAKFAAEKYGAHVVGITISKEQAELGKKRCKGLPVEIRLQDYRDVNEKFDHVVSLGMFEHVGEQNYKTYMEVVEKVLKDGGLFLLHTIGGNKSVKYTDPWIGKYIFPNSMLPSMKQVCEAAEGLFVMEDWHGFGVNYDKTLMTWYENFVGGWDEIKENYSDRFFRMWTYYLLACAGSFRARKNQLWQVVYSKKGILKGYKSIR